MFKQESIVSTPVKDVTDIKEIEEIDGPELLESAVITSTENEIENHEPSTTNENSKDEANCPVNEEKHTAIKTLADAREIPEETENIIVINDIETERNNQNVLKEVENKLDDHFKVNQNQNLESTNEIKRNNFHSTNNSKTGNEFDSTIENIEDGLSLTKQNENNYTEQHQDSKNDDLISEIIDRGNMHLNISDEIKILDDAVKNSIELGNSNIGKYLQINGELSPVTYDSTEQDFDEQIENCTVSNDDIDDDTDTKHIELQNSLNALLSGNFDTATVNDNNDKLVLITDSESKEDANDNTNENVTSQDSLSNSSDSETIINAECLQNEMIGDSVENSEQNPSVQPISVITIQTCDTVDSDCSEAYLTPNELNDTPKKIAENSRLNLNDRINVDNNDDVDFKSNPSVKPDNEVEIPSGNAPEAIVDPTTNTENIDIVEETVDATIDNNVVETDAAVVEKLENRVDTFEKNIVNTDTQKIIENCNENEREIKNILNTVPEYHDVRRTNNAEGTHMIFQVLFSIYHLFLE